MIEFLLKKGANPHLEDDQGLDCCDYAKKHHIEKIIELTNCQPDLRKKFVANKNILTSPIKITKKEIIESPEKSQIIKV